MRVGGRGERERERRSDTVGQLTSQCYGIPFNNYLSVYLSIYVSVYLSIYMSVYLSIYVSVYIYIWGPR